MMGYKRLFIWVEGSDDRRFVENIVNPILERRYDKVDVIEYAMTSKKYIDNYLKSIISMGGECIFLGDINSKPCITTKRKAIKEKHPQIDLDGIVVVVKEIESWYLAGLSDEACKKIGLTLDLVTDHITKEMFNILKPAKFDSRTDFMVEVLKSFSLLTAKAKNRSFNYFFKKYLNATRLV